MRHGRVSWFCVIVVGSACGGAQEELSPQVPAPAPAVLPSPVRQAVAPRAPDFGCEGVRDGLAHDRLSEVGGIPAMAAAAPGPWTLDALGRFLRAPTSAVCEATSARGALSGAGPGTVAGAVRTAAAWLGEAADFVDVHPDRILGDVQARLCSSPCEASGSLPPELAEAVAVVLARAQRAVEAERAHREHRGLRPDEDWARFGGDGLLAAPSGTGFDPDHPADLGFLSASRVEQYEAAAALADAVASVDWTPFAGLVGVDWRLQTPFGPVVVADAADHRHAFERAPLLLIDLGGDDAYLGREGSAGAERPVAVVVDLGGADLHAYPEYVETSTSDDLPADADGRWTGDRFVGVTASSTSRQAGARTGIALWFDLGSDDDAYVALRASQGYAHHGVAVLYDQGGDDVYRVEAAGQGAAQFGIGLLIDEGRGADRYYAEYTAQGHGYTAGVGGLLDDGGDDVYDCRPYGRRYPSPQLAQAQVSLCQGAGFGYRARNTTVMSGGLGLLIDGGGDDHYRAGVYAQGVGLSEGVGVLVDAGGSDTRDVLWHGLGAGVHGGVGALVDLGTAADRYGSDADAHNVRLGAGHDGALGVFFDAGGDDVYRLVGLSAGAATCGSVAVFVDEAGDDRYEGSGALGLGRAESAGCGRPGFALMVDAGGRDVYPADGAARELGVWRDDAGGYGVDGQGHSGFVSTGNAP